MYYKDIPLASFAPATKFTLGDLSSHRGKTIDEVISSSVDRYLERSNYNNAAEVSRILTSVGINIISVNSQLSLLGELMKRRHQLVHRADRDETGGSGKHIVRSIGLRTVREWIAAAEEFCNAVLGELST